MTIVSATGQTRGSNLVSGGIAGATLATFLKEFYLPGVHDQLNSKTILRRRLAARSDGVEGKYAVLELNTGRNTGYGYVTAGGKLPDPKAQQYRQAQYSMRYSYGRIKFDGVAASAARTDRGSFIRVMDSEMRGLTRDLLHNDNRVMFGNGTGRLAQISAVSGSTYTLRYPGGEVSTGAGTQYLEAGMTVACMTAANEATSGVGVGTGLRATGAGPIGATISSIDYSASTITVNSAWAGPAAAGEWIYLYGNTSDTTADGSTCNRGNEPNGLAAICDDANPTFQTGTNGFWPLGLGAVDTATTPVWKCGVIDSGGVATPFAPDMFQKGMDLADLNGDGTISAWYTTHGIRRQYMNGLVAQKTFPGQMELDGGFRVLTWGDRPIFVDKDCQKGRIYGLSEENTWIARETDYFWIDQDGNVLRRLDDYDAFQATMCCIWNLVTDARNRHVLIADIQDA